jgi:hypothetical protein
MLVIRRSRAVVAVAVVLFGVLVGAVCAETSAAESTAIVAMGDSEISGEGAGSYQAGTDGPYNYCHRSLNAWIKVIAMIPTLAAARPGACMPTSCRPAMAAPRPTGRPGPAGWPTWSPRCRAP